MFVTIQILSLVLFTYGVDAEFYEDSRCTCVCPDLEIGANKSHIGGTRSYYQDNHVLPEECNCKDMVLPRIEHKFNGSVLTYCLQCDCHFEIRNTTTIMIVVVSLLATISVLIMYMAYLYLLAKLVKYRKRNIIQQGDNEEQCLRLLNFEGIDISDEEEL